MFSDFFHRNGINNIPLERSVICLYNKNVILMRNQGEYKKNLFYGQNFRWGRMNIF